MATNSHSETSIDVEADYPGFIRRLEALNAQLGILTAKTSNLLADVVDTQETAIQTYDQQRSEHDALVGARNRIQGFSPKNMPLGSRLWHRIRRFTDSDYSEQFRQAEANIHESQKSLDSLGKLFTNFKSFHADVLALCNGASPALERVDAEVQTISSILRQEQQLTQNDLDWLGNSNTLAVVTSFRERLEALAELPAYQTVRLMLDPLTDIAALIESAQQCERNFKLIQGLLSPDPSRVAIHQSSAEFYGEHFQKKVSQFFKSHTDRTPTINDAKNLLDNIQEHLLNAAEGNGNSANSRGQITIHCRNANDPESWQSKLTALAKTFPDDSGWLNALATHLTELNALVQKRKAEGSHFNLSHALEEQPWTEPPAQKNRGLGSVRGGLGR